MRTRTSLLLFLFLCIASPAAHASDSNFSSLTGEEIKAVFREIDDVQFPEVGDGWNGGEWRLTFKPNGSWDDETKGVWGSWNVSDDKLCIAVVGGDTQWSTIFEGCLTVFIEPADAKIAGRFPGVSEKLFLMKEFAFDEIARVRPHKREPENLPKQKFAARAEKTVARADESAERKALEEQRLALERERLALERQRLEQEKRALELKKQEQSRPVAVDTTEPVIETVRSLSTVAETVTLTGVARDDSRVIRVEVGGEKVQLDTGTGRFSTTIQVALGKTEIPVTALDNHGNEAQFFVSVTRKRDIPEISYGRYHALVIGIDDYTSLPKLKTALIDAKAVAEMLETEYGYTVHLLENPTRTDIIDKLDDLRETLIEEDNLLIYYAGHGWLDEQTDTGYWMPVDAKANRRSHWVSNSDLTVALQGLFAKHVMVVADSCYSGTLTRSVKVPERNRAYLERIAEKRTRVVLSSGGLEPVADSGGGKHSVFAAQFLKALRQNEGVLDGTKLFEQVRETVVLNADQTPQYSDIRKAGHEGGDFLFVRRD